jgi:uncharacterized membrane protein
LDVVSLVMMLGGTAGTIAALLYLDGRVFNVVTYALTVPQSMSGSAWLFWVLPLVALGILVANVRPVAETKGESVRIVRWAAWPMLMPLAVGTLWITGGADALRIWLQSGGSVAKSAAVVLDFAMLMVLVAGLAISAARWPRRAGGRDVPAWLGYGLLVAGIIVATAWHAFAQYRFWQNFSFGYADFGFFTTELENCLPYKETGATRFANTRLGYHFIPLFYLLTPLYALFRSPVFLMVVGAAALHAPAIPFAWLARKRTGSWVAGLAAGFGWLLLPSVSRLPYANTYGFQSIYLAAAPLAAGLAMVFAEKRRAWILLVIALLAEETVCGVLCGLGLYLLCTGQRKAGIAIIGAAFVYLIAATNIFIPAASDAQRYTRLDLFGDVNALVVVQRLLRPRVWMYIAALVIPLWAGCSRRPVAMLIALPTLALVLLLQDDYLNIKYWHQTTILTALYAAAVYGATRVRADSEEAPASSPLRGILVAALVLHATLGYSPFAQAGRIAALPDAPAADDARVQAIAFVHAQFSASAYEILATERIAAHFIDYRHVEPVAGGGLAFAADRPALLVVDRADAWDRTVAESRVDALIAEAEQAGFVLAADFGDGRVGVWVRRSAGR